MNERVGERGRGKGGEGRGEKDGRGGSGDIVKRGGQGGPSIDGTRHVAHDLSARAVPQAKTIPSIGHSTTSQHNASQAIMDSSDEDTRIMLTMLNNRKKKRKWPIMWCREHFLLRSSRGEIHRPFCSLMTHRDKTLFFNFIRMSYRTYEELKNIVPPHLQPIGCNYQ
ncbi:hypothetical protein PoB_001979800 [Plakobranchus ocellatus]|uniref:Uncharacterized protein n=1 Tax=Plakobranchus ocellatus TaxID=259542 RepID=A0AAV3ZFP3_9GAST|nr:hypothetical protein PoB_001979800 [Plakobranchus ocellatus]